MTTDFFCFCDPLRTHRATVALKIKRLRHIKSLADWMRFFHLSNRQAGIVIGAYHPNGRNGMPYSKSHISRARAGQRELMPESLKSIAIGTSEIVSKQTEGLYKVKFLFDENWHIDIYRRCDSCTRYFKLERQNQKYCSWHRK